MASLKIYLNKTKFNQQGAAPLYLRFIHKRKATCLSTGIYLQENEWDEKNKRVKKNHPNSSRLNNLISAKIAEAEAKMLDLEIHEKLSDTVKVRNTLKGNTDILFFQFADTYIKRNQGNYKIATINKLRSSIEKIRGYTDNHDFLMEEITPGWLKRFDDYLKVNLKNRVNTIHGTLKNIRKLINEAIKEDLYPAEKSPFIKYKLKKEVSQKEFLNENELVELANLTLPKDSYYNHHRNIYLFSAYTGGLRISDILTLKWSNFDGERIIIQTQKTGSLVSILLPTISKQILQLYKPEIENPTAFIFPFLNNEIDYSNPKTLFNAISSRTAFANKQLKVLAEKAGIKKKIHFHTARHTFATLALRKGMRIEYVSKLMGHSNITTTQIYAKILNEELDKAMEVFN